MTKFKDVVLFFQFLQSPLTFCYPQLTMEGCVRSWCNWEIADNCTVDHITDEYLEAKSHRRMGRLDGSF